MVVSAAILLWHVRLSPLKRILQGFTRRKCISLVDGKCSLQDACYLIWEWSGCISVPSNRNLMLVLITPHSSAHLMRCAEAQAGATDRVRQPRPEVQLLVGSPARSSLLWLFERLVAKFQIWPIENAQPNNTTLRSSAGRPWWRNDENAASSGSWVWVERTTAWRNTAELLAKLSFYFCLKRQYLAVTGAGLYLDDTYFIWSGGFNYCETLSTRPLSGVLTSQSWLLTRELNLPDIM